MTGGPISSTGCLVTDYWRIAGGGGVPKDWPRQLYHYGADGTDEDVETIGV
jgi:hypothetical protein